VKNNLVPNFTDRGSCGAVVAHKKRISIKQGYQGKMQMDAFVCDNSASHLRSRRQLRKIFSTEVSQLN
jgi:hypothetical protein